MSIKLMSRVFEELCLPPAQKLVLLALADHAHDDGTSARPGVAYLGWKTDMSERTVQRALRDLEQLELIIPSSRLKGGSGHVTEYVLNLDATTKGVTRKGDKLAWVTDSARKGDKWRATYKEEPSRTIRKASLEKPKAGPAVDQGMVLPAWSDERRKMLEGLAVSDTPSPYTQIKKGD